MCSECCQQGTLQKSLSIQHLLTELFGKTTKYTLDPMLCQRDRILLSSVYESHSIQCRKPAPKLRRVSLQSRVTTTVVTLLERRVSPVEVVMLDGLITPKS